MAQSLCFEHEQPRSLRSAPLMPCLSAADAFADKQRMGIGGWLSTARSFVWFSEIFADEEVRQLPCFDEKVLEFIDGNVCIVACDIPHLW